MKLIILTSESVFEEESILLNELFDEGMETLHIRKPFATEEEIYHLLSKIDFKYHRQIVLHDHFSLLKVFNLMGVHLNQRNSTRPQTMNISISCSCHSFECIEVLMNNYDYIFLSPIFDSISKVEYNHAFTEEQLQEAKSKQLINRKVMALGGIDQKTISLAAQYGFGGVAVLGYLWKGYLQNKDERALLQSFKNLQIIARSQ